LSRGFSNWTHHSQYDYLNVYDIQWAVKGGASVTIDWTLRENIRAQLRVLVKRVLRRHGYPPDKQEKANQTVLEQAELLSFQAAEAA
jgi:type I restriction enzyme R subunit